MSDRSVNYLWLNSELSNSPIYGRVPDVLIDNVLETHNANPNVTFSFWNNPNKWSVYGQNQLSRIEADGIQLCDINAYPEFANCSLFAQDISTQRDRLIKWRQIDLAKVLIASITLPKFDQTFFSDMDILGLKIDSPEIQEPMLKHGLIVGAGKSIGLLNFENQFFGFNEKAKDFLDFLLLRTKMVTTIADGDNGYQVLLSALGREKKDVINEIQYIPEYCMEI